AGNQGVPVALPEPMKKVLYQHRHTTGRWRHMQQARSAIDAYSALTEMPGILDQATHQQAMSSQQIGLAIWPPRGHRIIGGERIPHLLDLTWQPQYLLAIQ